MYWVVTFEKDIQISVWNGLLVETIVKIRTRPLSSSERRGEADANTYLPQINTISPEITQMRNHRKESVLEIVLNDKGMSPSRCKMPGSLSRQHSVIHFVMVQAYVLRVVIEAKGKFNAWYWVVQHRIPLPRTTRHVVHMFTRVLQWQLKEIRTTEPWSHPIHIVTKCKIISHDDVQIVYENCKLHHLGEKTVYKERTWYWERPHFSSVSEHWTLNISFGSTTGDWSLGTGAYRTRFISLRRFT